MAEDFQSKQAEMMKLQRDYIELLENDRDSLINEKNQIIERLPT